MRYCSRQPPTLAEAEGSSRQLYERHAPLIRFLGELGTAPPKVLHMTAEFVLNGSLRRAFEEEDLDLDRIRTLLDAAQRERVQLDGAGLSYALNHSIELVGCNGGRRVVHHHAAFAGSAGLCLRRRK